MSKLTVETENVDACMTSLTGYLTLERSKLVALFGEPDADAFAADKVYCEWALKFTDENGDSGIVTVYDWENHDNSAGADDYKDWHVGGHSYMALEVLQDYINQEGIEGTHTRTYL